jgi:ribonuclease J
MRLFALGGLGEVGMNCMALVANRGSEERVLIVDCGVTFDRAYGAPIVHPDFSALEAWRDRITGVFLTHGHEDHIGALPHLLRRFDVPVWGPKYALELVRERIAEYEVLDHARLEVVKTREEIEVGPFRVEPVRVTHSIADATSLVIRAEGETIIHTGDFKFDPNPPDGETFDEERFREVGDAGVSLLLSDSTNSFAPGETASETAVGDALRDLVCAAKGAVFITLFASNVHRLRLLGDVARASNRKIVLLGRSVETHARVARMTGYLPWPSDVVWPRERARELPRSSVLAIATGSQGEARGALARLASERIDELRIVPGDTVVLSSRVIPGNDREIYRVIDDLLRRGAIVRSWLSDRGIHTSGHAHRSEQRRMLDLVRPKAFVPVHGTIHQLMQHADTARAAGVSNVLVAENGDVVEVTKGSIKKVDRVPTGRIHVTDEGVEVPPAVMGDRARLAHEGFVHITLVEGIAGLEAHVVTQGVIDPEGSGPILEAARREAVRAYSAEDAIDPAEEARLAVRRVFHRETGSRPETHVTVVTSPR